MAYAFKDKSGWIASFKPPWSKRQRRKRIPADQLAHGDPEAAARAFADELERYARLMEGEPKEAQIDHAAALGVIDADTANSLRQDMTIPIVKPSGAKPRPTLLDAADAHPSTRHEAASSPADYDRHLSGLKEFIAWSGLAFVDQINLDVVQRYITHLRAGLGLEYPSRRHRLLWLRRACAMGAAAHGLPNPLAGFVLDRDDSPPVVQTWTPEELCAAAAYFHASANPRALAALALGGFLGLRPSEMTRALVSDYDPQNKVLHVGRRKRKNPTSARMLPVPAVAAAWLKEWCEGRPPLAPILEPSKRIRRAAGTEYDHRGFEDWLRPNLAKATGRDLKVKDLRKSFATWAIALDCPPALVDEFMGHKVSGVSAITARHYLAAARLAQLRLVADKIDADAAQKLRDLLQKA